MKLGPIIQKIGASAPFLGGGKGQITSAPVLGEAVRFPYGPFRFRSRLVKGAAYSVFASTDLKTWSISGEGAAKEDMLEYVDSEAFKYPYRFYRLRVGKLCSVNVIGYASVSLPPGFSMIANPFDSTQSVGEVFRNWPEGTTLNKFDTLLFRLSENGVNAGKWTNPEERLAHGEGAIFFNPTSDYKSVSFVGAVVQGNLSVPIPSGFSVRSPLLPQPGNLADDLKFPIANGDVIHLFDREGQKYVLHPFEEGKWTAGAPVISVGEAFWVAKTEPGNWIYQLEIPDPVPEPRDTRKG